MDAELMGKLPSCEARDLYHMEDILTSYVFGAFKYMDPSILFTRFLNTASVLEDSSDEESGMKEKEFSIQFARIKVLFWPKTSAGEPDVVVIGQTEHDEERYVMIFECKFLSGLGKTAEDNQLTRYASLLHDGRIEFLQGLGIGQDAKPLGLFYITGDSVAPSDDFEQTMLLLRSQNREMEMSSLFWLSWKTLWRLVNSILDDNPDVAVETKSLLCDLRDVLVKRGMRKFTGFYSDFSARIVWSYESAKSVKPSNDYFEGLFREAIDGFTIYQGRNASG